MKLNYVVTSCGNCPACRSKEKDAFLYTKEYWCYFNIDKMDVSPSVLSEEISQFCPLISLQKEGE